MKNVNRNIPKFNRIITLLILGWLWLPVFGQAEFDDVITFESEISPDGMVSLTNRSFDVDIQTWNNSSAELQLRVKLRARDQNDIDRTLDAINDIEFKKSGSRLTINTVFWESITSNTNHKIKLKNGDKVVLKEFDVEVTLMIPKTVSMEIDNKYADIRMAEIAGGADIKFYSGKFYAKSFGAPVDFNFRYSKAFLDDVPGADMELYDSDVEMKTCGNLKLQSKYSKIEIENTGDIDFVSYDDKLTIGKLGTIDGDAKYSDFDFGPSVNLTFDFYDCNLKGGDTGDVKGKSKYTQMELGNTGAIVLEMSYDDTFMFGDIASFDCSESKYSDFKIASLSGEFALNSYDDNVLIDEVSVEFTGITITGKYGDYRLTIPDSAAYRFLVDMKYGHVDYPESNFDRKTYIKENSNLVMDVTTKNAGGTVPVIDIKGQDNRIIIKD